MQSFREPGFWKLCYVQYIYLKSPWVSIFRDRKTGGGEGVLKRGRLRVVLVEVNKNMGKTTLWSLGDAKQDFSYCSLILNRSPSPHPLHPWPF